MKIITILLFLTALIAGCNNSESEDEAKVLPDLQVRGVVGPIPDPQSAPFAYAHILLRYASDEIRANTENATLRIRNLTNGVIVDEYFVNVPTELFRGNAYIYQIVKSLPVGYDETANRTIEVTIDYDNVIYESNENNNVVVLPLSYVPVFIQGTT